MKIKAVHLRETARLGVHYSKLWQVGAQGVESIEAVDTAGGGFEVRVTAHVLTGEVKKLVFMPASMVEHAEYEQEEKPVVKAAGKVPPPPSA